MKNTIVVTLRNESSDTELRLRRSYHVPLARLPELVGFLEKFELVRKGRPVKHIKQ